MSALPPNQALDEYEIFSEIAEALAGPGYFCRDGLLPAAVLEPLHALIERSDDEAFQPAGIGRERDFHLNTSIRRDRILWLEDQPEAQGMLQWMERLRIHLNRTLYLGLFDYEAHVARYAPGAFYKRHLDAFRGRGLRRVTTVLYLNRDWQCGDGGELLLYPPEGDTVLASLAPQWGRLVVFLSDQFPHEVLPAQRLRLSVAGWFRLNNSLNGQIDPPR